MKKCKGDNRFGIPAQCNDDAIEEYEYCEYHLDPSVKAIRSGCRDIVDKLEKNKQELIEAINKSSYWNTPHRRCGVR